MSNIKNICPSDNVLQLKSLSLGKNKDQTGHSYHYLGESDRVGGVLSSLAGQV